jgi:NADPH:quinone reductase-like Zn-dependent oxidoreductase
MSSELGVQAATMKAIVQDRYGTADVLELARVDKPAPKDDEVLVRVQTAGVDAGVWHLMTGLPYLVRLFGFGVRRPKVRVRGRDVAGRVEAVGRVVTRFQPGDEVFGICEGSFAEYACVREDKVLLPKPANLSFEQAAAVPISALTALQALRDKGKVQAGQKVLIIGAGGGVGSFAVQLAKAFGAEVTGVCSTSKVDLVRSIGADEVVDYTRNDFADGARRWDLILDTAGNRPLSRLRRALAPRGTLVLVGGESEGRWLGGTERLLRAFLLSPLVRQRLRGFISSERTEDLQVLRELIEAGKLTPVLDRSYPLGEAPEAIRHWEQGRARGKVVVTVAGATG